MVNLLNATKVPASFERRREVSFNDLESEVGRNEACWKRKNVGIVVLASQLCQFDSPTESATDVRIFVYSHLNTIARSTDYDAPRIGSIVDDLSNLVSKIGIVTAFGAVGTIIDNFETFGGKKLFDLLFEFKTSVIGGDRDYFFHEDED